MKSDNIIIITAWDIYKKKIKGKLISKTSDLRYIL